METVEKIQFEVENIKGVLKYTPEKLDVNKVIGLVRITSSDEKKDNLIVFDCHGKQYNTHKQLSAYGLPHYVCDFILYNENSSSGVLVNNINEFEFVILPETIKLTVELFEHQKINTSRKLFKGDFMVDNKNATELNVTLFGNDKKNNKNDTV